MKENEDNVKAPLSKRTKIISLIAVFNIVIGILGIILSLPFITLFISIKYGGIPTYKNGITIKQVLPNSPAEQAQLKQDDKILSINDSNVSKTNEFIDMVNTNKGKNVEIRIERNGQIHSVQLTPRNNPPVGEGSVGINIVDQSLKIDKQPLALLVPTTIIRAYQGTELRLISPLVPARPGFSYEYRDKSFTRLKELVYGVAYIVLGVGLWTMRKWGLYLNIGLTGLGLVLSIPYLFNLANYNALFRSFGSNMSGSINIMTALVNIGVDILIVVYLYKQRKLFQ